MKGYSCKEAREDLKIFSQHSLGDEKKEMDAFRRAHLHAIGSHYSEHICCPQCWEEIKKKKGY